jgi:hypothetical protein
MIANNNDSQIFTCRRVYVPTCRRADVPTQWKCDDDIKPWRNPLVPGGNPCPIPIFPHLSASDAFSLSPAPLGAHTSLRKKEPQNFWCSVRCLVPWDEWGSQLCGRWMSDDLRGTNVVTNGWEVRITLQVCRSPYSVVHQAKRALPSYCFPKNSSSPINLPLQPCHSQEATDPHCCRRYVS